MRSPAFVAGIRSGKSSRSAVALTIPDPPLVFGAMKPLYLLAYRLSLALALHRN